MDLADAWVVEIIKSNLTGAERHKRWPKVFASDNIRTEEMNASNKVLSTNVYFLHSLFKLH